MDTVTNREEAAIDDGPGRSRRAVIVSTSVLAAWTLFVWVGRIRNVAVDEELTGFATVWRIGLASVFSLSALALLGAIVNWLRGPDRGGPPTPAVRATAGWLAVFGIVVWVIRGTDIALGDHPTSFIVVHVVLAVVTIGLGAVVLNSLRPLPFETHG